MSRGRSSFEWKSKEKSDPITTEEMTTQKERRIVLVGKTGAGKSAAANSILGEELFETELSPTSLTAHCQKVKGKVGNRPVAVIDTPGLFDTNLGEEEVLERIKMCISLSSPGPHVFLVALQLGRFTEEERRSVEKLQIMFGKDVDRFSIVLFTHGDRLHKQTIEQYIAKSVPLTSLIQTCRGQYHVFNNEIKDLSQVTRLLDKIDKLIADNSGRYYTTEMFSKAEEAIQEEKERLLKESEERKEKELEELRIRYHGAELQQRERQLLDHYESQARSQAEKSNSFTKTRLVFKEMGWGALCGLGVGALLGPAGMVIGAFLGAIGGGIAGGAIYRREKRKKSMRFS